MIPRHVPKNPLKPPLHYLHPSRPVPSLPIIEPKEAVATLTNGEWAARVLRGRQIKCLRDILALLIEADTLPSDFDQVVFDRVVIQHGDLSELEIPFKLHFQEVFFLDGLNLNSSCFPLLSVSGYVRYGLSLVETSGRPGVNLANLEADQVHIYGGEGVGHLDTSNSTLGALSIACIKVERDISLRDSVVGPDGLWLENVGVGGIYLLRSVVQKYFRIHGVSCTGNLELQTCNLDAPLSTRGSTCTKLSLSESVCSGRLDFRNLSFSELDVANVSVPGQLLLSLDQLQAKKRATWAAPWDTPPKLVPQKSATLGELVTIAEQLIALRENFRRIPTTDREERYCAYQLADATWQVCCWRLVDRTVKCILRQGFGYLLFPSRIVRTMGLLIAFFTGLYFALPKLGVGGLSLSSGSPITMDGTLMDISRCLYFSTLTFCTSPYGDVYPVGPIKAVAAMEAFVGLIVVALFVVALARRLFRW